MKLSDFQTVDPKSLISKSKDSESNKYDSKAQQKIIKNISLNTILHSANEMDDSQEESDEECESMEPRPQKLFGNC